MVPSGSPGPSPGSGSRRRLPPGYAGALGRPDTAQVVPWSQHGVGALKAAAYQHTPAGQQLRVDQTVRMQR